MMMATTVNIMLISFIAAAVRVVKETQTLAYPCALQEKKRTEARANHLDRQTARHPPGLFS